MATKKNNSPTLPLDEFKPAKASKTSPKPLPTQHKSDIHMGTTSNATASHTSFKPAPMQTSSSSHGPKTRVVVKYDVGFNNVIYIRGKGANLNWDKGIPLKNLKADEWVWECELSFTKCEFKVLVNDAQYEIGENHPLNCGATVQYTPQF
jgi:hypothetical protein